MRRLLSLGLYGAFLLLAGCLPTTPTVTPTRTPQPAEVSKATASVPSFRQDLLPMFRGCDCHGIEPGRFVPTTYAGVRSVVVPGDPAASAIVQMMTEGHHTGVNLSQEELAVVIRWIEAGAPDN